MRFPRWAGSTWIGRSKVVWRIVRINFKIFLIRGHVEVRVHGGYHELHTVHRCASNGPKNAAIGAKKRPFNASLQVVLAVLTHHELVDEAGGVVAVAGLQPVAPSDCAIGDQGAHEEANNQRMGGFVHEPMDEVFVREPRRMVFFSSQTKGRGLFISSQTFAGDEAHEGSVLLEGAPHGRLARLQFPEVLFHRRVRDEVEGRRAVDLVEAEEHLGVEVRRQLPVPDWWVYKMVIGE